MTQIDKITLKEAKELATLWQKRIEKETKHSEKKFHQTMKRMLKDTKNKLFLIELLDQSFRSLDKHRIANQLEYLFEKYENTSFFTDFEQLLVWIFRNLGLHVTSVSVPLFIKYLRNDIKNIVLYGEDKALSTHLLKRKKEDTQVNLNIIGEAVLGEEEAQERIQKYIVALKNPNIEYVSIKVSTIFSQIHPIAHEWSVEQISLRLEKIYDAAIENGDKFINLDMEEYRDISLTIDVFTQTLSQKKYQNLYAGIVIQAYIPEALSYVKRLHVWAKERVDNGGAPIKVRLVKGANQEMELTEASLRGWACVTYVKKSQSDANFKLLMNFLLQKEVASCLHVGIASHNLFDQALAFLLARKRGVEEFYSAEMLEGMSEAAYHILKKQKINVILYAPTATSETFTNAIAYLVRRFDENTAEQNYLRHSFGLKVGSKAWSVLLKSYDDSIKNLEDLSLTQHRVQDRNNELKQSVAEPKNYLFKNESDTDFSLRKNQHWAEEIAQKYKDISKDNVLKIYPNIASEEVQNGVRKEQIDKSQYHEKRILAECVMAQKEDLTRALHVAKEDKDNWSCVTINERAKILMNVAQVFRDKRADLIGIAAAEVGKTFIETDVEISEAIDFLNFYPFSVRKLSEIEGINLREKGVALVISPWNFPIAIAVGGIAAALSTGNRVILKPSSEAIVTAQMLCQCFWDGGVSKNVLQFAPSEAKDVREYLIKSEDVDFVIFTGGETTALDILKSRPNIHLSAETGGKDSTIVTALADRDQAVKNVIASAFNNSGQKCSATSLLVLERELYEDEKFKQMLLDATLSLSVGSVWNLENKIGTLVNLPSGNLKKALETLDAGEEWLIKPTYADNENPYMLKPSIRWGTQKGDFTHLNELFGPVLSVMYAEDLEDAIEIVNATGYGLTAGLESLDEREQEIFKKKIKAGNLYINRVTTGAVVLRQPFGGMGKSAIGSGKKAGGFNYIYQFLNISFDAKILQEIGHHSYVERLKKILKEETQHQTILQDAIKTIKHFAFWLEKEFFKEHDYVNLRGESNHSRYLHVEKMSLVVAEDDSLYELICSIVGAKMAGVALHVSLPQKINSSKMLWLMGKIPLLLDANDTLVNEDKQARAKSIKNSNRVRCLSAKNIEKELYISAAESALHVASEPFVSYARVELLHFFVEQSVSDSYHRYGNLGQKALGKKEI